ncbi:MAG: hypothetical protein LBQ94_01890 [Treponema sp.]|nr:hypothetical protein [Treponema sp.]
MLRVLNGGGFREDINFDRRSLLSSYGGFGTSVFVRFPGNASVGNKVSFGTFVLAVPMYARFAVDTALTLAETLRNRDSHINILIAFLGDEKNELPESSADDPQLFFLSESISHKGLRDLLSLTDMPENWVICYFDADEVPAELVLHHGRRGYVAPLEIISPLLSLLKAGDIPWSLEVRHLAIYKLGFDEGPEALGITWGEEVNAFTLSGEKTGNRKKTSGEETISPAALAEVLLEYSRELNFPVINPDRHYSFFSFPGGNFFFAGERFTVILLLLATAIILSLYLAYSARHNAIMLFHFRLFFRSFWIFLILLPLMVLSLKLSGFFYSTLLGTLDPLLLGALPGPTVNAGAGLTILLAILVFVLVSPIFNIIRFPTRARFYGFSAVIFIIAGTLSAAFLDFTFVTVFLWSTFFVFLGASVSNPILVFLSALSIPLFASGALLNLLQTGNGRFAELFFPQNWNAPESWVAAIQTALFSLPIVLLVKRGSILLRKSFPRDTGQKPRRKYSLIVILILFAAVLLAMFVQILVIGRGRPPERRSLIEGNDSYPEILSISTEEIIFQDSRIINLRLEAGGSPARFDVSIEGEDGKTLLPVYSAPVPFERESEGKRVVFFLGEYPPNPLTLEIVLPLDFEGILKTSVVYNKWESGVDPAEKPETDDYVFVVSKSRKI